MNEHIEFERLYNYIFTDSFSSDFIEDAIEINSHVLACEQCKKIYNILIKLNESIETLNRMNALEAEKAVEAELKRLIEENNKQQKKEKIKNKILAAFNKMSDIPDDIADEIDDFKNFVKEKAESIALEVKDFTNIVCDGQGKGMQFGYLRPAYGIVNKSVDGELVKNDITTSKMVDGNNSISVDEGTNSIKIVLDADAVPGSIVCLVPENGDAVVKVLDNDCLDEYSNTIEFVFSDIKPGNYDIVWQSDID